MTTTRAEESRAEAIVAALMIVVFWSVFSCLAGGLALWVWGGGSGFAALLLNAGLLALMLLPTLRLVAAIATAHREGDWLLFASTLAVLAILFALTLRQAAQLE